MMSARVVLWRSGAVLILPIDVSLNVALHVTNRHILGILYIE